MPRLICLLLAAAMIGGCVPHSRVALTISDRLSFPQIVRQQYETSCGAAALATIMSFFFLEQTTESEILLLAAPTGDVPDRGLSIEDLKLAAIAKGYRAAPAEVGISTLLQLPEPAIVVLCPSEACPPGNLHFSVFVGGTPSVVQLADPSRGRIVMSTASFARKWSGVILAISKDGPKSPSFFHRPRNPIRVRPSLFNSPSTSVM